MRDSINNSVKVLIEFWRKQTAVSVVHIQWYGTRREINFVTS